MGARNMLTYLSRLTAERDSLTRTANGIADAAATEQRDLTEPEQESLRTMQERCAVIDGQLTTYNAQAEGQRAYAQLRNAITLDQGGADDERQARRVARREPAELQSWGELFVRSAELADYHGRGRSGEVEVPGIFTRAATDPIMVGPPPTPWTNWLQPSRYMPQPPAITTPLLDNVGHVTTANNFVTLYSLPATYPKAQVVAEGALKPASDIVPTETAHNLNTYAHWKPISRQALEDLPQIRSIVENYLRGGIYAAIEADVGAALAAAPLATTPGGTDPLAAIRRALATVQSQGFPNANSVLLNPVDWGSLDIAVMASTMNGPNAGSGFWGLAPIPSAGIPQGTAYVGDLRVGITVYDRGTASVFMSDSHADYFIRNLLVVLAEARALGVVEQPAALVAVTGIVPPAPTALGTEPTVSAK